MSTDLDDRIGLTPNDSLRILQLRLAIARAGQSDSMGWWADESLTPDATFLLGRLFPRSIERSRQRLALRAAHARHRVELVTFPNARHLFDFGDGVEFEIAQAFRRETLAQYPPEPIKSLDELQAAVADILGNSTIPALGGSRRGRVLEIEVEDRLAPARAAELLAWSYVQTEAGGPIFPFFRGQR